MDNHIKLIFHRSLFWWYFAQQYHFFSTIFYGTSIVNCTVYPGNKDIKLEHWIHIYSYRTFFTMHNRTVSHTLHIFMLKQMKWWIAHFTVCINNSSIPFSGVILLHCSVTALSFPQYWVPAQHPCCQCFEAWQTGLICHLSCMQFTLICMTLLVLKPGGRLNKKDGLTRYGDSHVKDKTS